MSNNGQGVVKYPDSFLSRPCDRIFISFLENKKVGAYCAYRIWADFSTGSSDRRRLSKSLENGAVARNDREVLILEEYCDWDGPRGDMVRAAVDSGFMVINDTGEFSELICSEFYPLNSKAALTMQQKGAYAKILKKANLETAQSSVSQMEIFERNSHEVSKVELTSEQKTEAVKLIQIVGRVMHFKPLAGSDWSASMVEGAADVCNRYLVDERETTLRWLMVHRGDSDIPKRVDLIIKKFDDYMKSARMDG